MKHRRLLALCAAALLLAAVLAGCKPAKPFTVGAFDGKTYTNDSFGLTFTVPDSWVILPKDQIKAIAGASDDMLASDGDDLSKKQSLYLAYVMKSDPATATEFNSNFSFITTNLGLLAYTVKSDKEFLQKSLDESKESLASQGIECDFGDIESKTLGGTQFAVVESKTTYSGVEFNQRMYCAIKNKYALMFTFTWISDDDLKALESITDSMSFGK